MTRRLIIQSLGNPPDTFDKYMDIARPIHEDYAARCGAEYEMFVGMKEAGVNPTWNRLPMMLDAFGRGYEQVAWFDADVLVVNPNRNIFDEVQGAPLHMTRTEGFPWWTPNGEQEAWNDGMLLAENCPEAIAALDWTWARRNDPFLDHQVPGMPELSWLLDYVFTQPDSLVGVLPRAWNSNSFAVTRETNPEVAIEAFHGMRHHERWDAFQACYYAYGALSAWA